MTMVNDGGGQERGVGSRRDGHAGTFNSQRLEMALEIVHSQQSLQTRNVLAKLLTVVEYRAICDFPDR